MCQVVLPEGSSHASAKLPFAAEEALEKKYSYLDTVGRPVLTLHKANVVPDHNAPIEITYRFASVYLLQVGALAHHGCMLTRSPPIHQEERHMVWCPAVSIT